MEKKMRYKLLLAYFPNEETETQRSSVICWNSTPPEPDLETFDLIIPLKKNTFILFIIYLFGFIRMRDLQSSLQHL